MPSSKSNTYPTRFTSIRLEQLALRTDAFQFRGEDLIESHVVELLEQPIPSKGYDPIDVWSCPDTAELIVLDGHHRFEAYKRAGWKSKVPVKLHLCTPREATLVALSENSKVRQPLSKNEKLNAMWILIQQRKDGGEAEYTKRELAAMNLASDRTVANMRKAYKQFADEGEGIPQTWADVLSLNRNTQNNDEWDAVEWIKARSSALDDQLGKAFGEEFAKCPDAAVNVFEKRAGKQGRSLIVDRWGLHEVSEDPEALGSLAYAIYELLSPEATAELMSSVESLRGLEI